MTLDPRWTWVPVGGSVVKTFLLTPEKTFKRTNFGEFDGADAVKAWSLVEFLLAQHREKFIAFLQLFKDGKDVEAALDETWGWTISDLDYRWNLRTA